jgi:hypothetical protein
VKKLEGYVTFLDLDGWHNFTCHANLEIDHQGKFSGTMYNCDNPGDTMAILEGDFAKYECKFDFYLNSEKYRVILKSKSMTNSCNHNELGLIGKYGKNDTLVGTAFGSFEVVKTA